MLIEAVERSKKSLLIPLKPYFKTYKKQECEKRRINQQVFSVLATENAFFQAVESCSFFITKSFFHKC